MFGLIFVAATIVQTISSQGPPHPFPQNIPEQCRRPPQDGGKPHECCKIPPLFPEDDFKECGFDKIGENEPPPRRGPPDCSKQLCILKKNGLLNDDNAIDSGKAESFLDNFVDNNADFKSPIEIAKKNCLGKERLPGPPFICEENKIFMCIKAILFSHCPDLPVWEKSEACSKLKDHIEECTPYFMPPPPPAPPTE